MKKYKKQTKDLVGAGVMMGVGSIALGQMGQGTMAGQIFTPAGNMMGVVGTGMGGMAVIDIVDKQSKKMNKKNKYY